MNKTDFEALAEFRYQLRRFLRFSETAVQSEGMTPLHYQLLLQIKGFPGRSWATIGELAERLQASHHGTVALVSRCESAGLVRREKDPDDRRQVRVHLTESGDQQITRLARMHRDELRSLARVFRVTRLAEFNDRD
ncbi:MAG TPA: MarR family transcriptional regulator [Steroidobacteraceae bacterium]|nr:MarR family transcriptional regulator [Steroidobacteraceae bacterium]